MAKDTDEASTRQDSILADDANPGTSGAADPSGSKVLTPGTGVIRMIGNRPSLRLIKSPKLSTFEDLVPGPREFSWKPYLPRGGLAVIAGMGSHGKTTLGTAMLAWASTGNWPHSAPTDPIKFLIIEFQDDDANEIKPKLLANAYDPKNVLRLTTKKCPSYEELEAVIRENELGMVMISPGRRYVMQYVSNENNNAEVEPVLDKRPVTARNSVTVRDRRWRTRFVRQGRLSLGHSAFHGGSGCRSRGLINPVASEAGRTRHSGAEG